MKLASQNILKTAMIGAALLSTLTSEAAPLVVKLQNGLSNSITGAYSGMSNSLIISSTPNQNYGAAGSIQFGSVGTEIRKTLLRFDLTAFAGMQIEGDATFTLYQRNPFGAEVKVSLYQISAANAGWNEGNGGTGAADPGESAWNFLSQGSPATPWAGSAGLSTSGVDFLSGPLVTFDYIPSGVNGTAINITIAGSVLQGWIDDPSSNAGLLLVANTQMAGEYGTFYNNMAVQGVRPSLNFAVVPEPSTIALIVAGAFGLLTFRRHRRA